MTIVITVSGDLTVLSAPTVRVSPLAASVARVSGERGSLNAPKGRGWGSLRLFQGGAARY
jgi:hypothetical protein